MKYKHPHTGKNHVGRFQILSRNGYFIVWTLIFRGSGAFLNDHGAWTRKEDEGAQFSSRGNAIEAIRNAEPVPSKKEMFGEGL